MTKIEEIKESEFERYHDRHIINRTVWSKVDFKECWQASQDNRDLLYKDLINEIDAYFKAKIAPFGGLVEKELEKIKVTLSKSNE